jgi:hypothetical protein
MKYALNTNSGYILKDSNEFGINSASTNHHFRQWVWLDVLIMDLYISHGIGAKNALTIGRR